MYVSAITNFRSQQQACVYLQQLNFKANNVSEITEYQSQQQICFFYVCLQLLHIVTNILYECLLLLDIEANTYASATSKNQGQQHTRLL